MNWPVAGPVANYLGTIADKITPQIVKVLRGSEPTWKYWCLIIFGRIKPIDPLLLKEIEFLVKHVSKPEIEEGVLEEAQAILKESRS